MKPFLSNKAYSGIDRRSTFERRVGAERRNLVRYESIGCDRRAKPHRRAEDAAWSSKIPHI